MAPTTQQIIASIDLRILIGTAIEKIPNSWAIIPANNTSSLVSLIPIDCQFPHVLQTGQNQPADSQF